MDANLLGTLTSQLTPDRIRQISGVIGADEKQTATAISTALPALLGGLSQNAANPQGAMSLNRALDDHDGSLLDNLGGLLGGGAGNALGGGIGGAILGHIFGNRRGNVEDGVAKTSGLNGAQVAQLLALLAPIVMAALGKMKRQQGIDANRLPDVLNESATQAQRQSGGLGGMLDANKDGNIADDVIRMGGSILGGMFKK